MMNFLTSARTFQLQRNFPTSAKLSNLKKTFQLRSVVFPILAKLFNFKLSNFSFFPTALSNYTYPGNRESKIFEISGTVPDIGSRRSLAMTSFDPVWPLTWFDRFLRATVGSQNEFESKPKVSSCGLVDRRHSPNFQIWWLKFLNLISRRTNIGISFSWISRFGTKCRFFGIFGIFCNLSVKFGEALWWATVSLVKIFEIYQ